MYIMVKTYQNLELFGPDLRQELSILVASIMINQRGLRKSSSLTNGMGCSETKISLESMAKKARGLLSKSLSTNVIGPSRASLMRSV
jgi:hypothetical protein